MLTKWDNLEYLRDCWRWRTFQNKQHRTWFENRMVSQVHFNQLICTICIKIKLSFRLHRLLFQTHITQPHQSLLHALPFDSVTSNNVKHCYVHRANWRASQTVGLKGRKIINGRFILQYLHEKTVYAHQSSTRTGASNQHMFRIYTKKKV